MNLSYQEKSIWGALIATLLVYGQYFRSSPRGNLVVTIVALVVIQIIFQTVIALADKPQPKDERDRLIDARAYKAGYLALVTGVLVSMAVVKPTVDTLLLALIAAEVFKSVAQLVYYRRGL